MKNALVIGALFLAGILACGEDSVEPPPNRPPVVGGLHDTTATIGDTLFMTFDAHDPDGDYLSYAFGVVRNRTEIETAYWPRYGVYWDDLVYWYLPAERDGPARTFQFRAKDSEGAKATIRFTVEILPGEAP